MKIATKNPLVKYENRWVALDREKNRVVGFGKSLEELEGKLTQYKVRDFNISVLRVPPFDRAYAPFN